MHDVKNIVITLEGLNIAIRSLIYEYEKKLTHENLNAIKFLSELQEIHLEKMENHWLVYKSNTEKYDETFNIAVTNVYYLNAALSSISNAAESELIAIDSLINSAKTLCIEQASALTRIKELVEQAADLERVNNNV